jgi:hypothetical protein
LTDYFINPPRNNEISGNAEINKQANSNMAIYGPSFRITSMYGLSKMAQHVKILVPKGGVPEPMATCSVIKIPKCTKSIPAFWAIGAKIGARIRITTMASTNIQPMKKTMLTVSRIRKTDADSPSKPCVSI